MGWPGPQHPSASISLEILLSVWHVRADLVSPQHKSNTQLIMFAHTSQRQTQLPGDKSTVRAVLKTERLPLNAVCPAETVSLSGPRVP